MTKLRLGYATQSKYFLDLEPLHDYFEFIPANQTQPTDLVISEILNPAVTTNPIIVNNLFEQTRSYNGNSLHLTGRWFFWAHEYYQNIKYKRDQVDTFSTRKSKLALMPMGNLRPHRTRAREVFEPLLDKMYWSYLAQGKTLPMNLQRDRQVEPLWYKDTFTSVVCETTMLDQMFITEKTFKPLSYDHPLLVIGNQHLLRELKQQGFETFDNIFDESYDAIEDADKRIQGVYQNVLELDNRELVYDNETVSRVKHNRELFYNKQRVDSIIINEIVNPILEYAETRH